MARGLMARLEPLTEPERWTAWIGSEVGHRRLTARELGCSGEFRVEPVVGGLAANRSGILWLAVGVTVPFNDSLTIMTEE